MFPRILQFLLLAFLLAATMASATRIKDISVVRGLRDNQLNGYGLVTGLAGDGDSRLNYTQESLGNMLERYGIKVDPTQITADNVAAVIVTADIPPNAKPGERIDVTVASLGDAESLQGGILLQTALLGADEQVYAVAQGPIAVGGFIGGVGGAGGATVQQNHPTVGKIPGGGIVEREIPHEVIVDGGYELLLLNPDVTTAVRMAEVINERFPGVAQARDARSVHVLVPTDFTGQEVNYQAHVGLLEVMPDVTARVIINERTGTIVATQNVRISTVAVSHGSLTIRIASTLNVSQPEAFAQGDTAIVPATETTVTEDPGGFHVVENFPTIEELTAALNAMGVTTREMITILQTLKEAGALQAELIIN